MTEGRTIQDPKAARPVDERLTWSIPETARLLGISRAAAYTAAHRGELRVKWVGHRMLVPRAALLRLLQIDPVEQG
jgi:excisionase family DNA binding protein